VAQALKLAASSLGSTPVGQGSGLPWLSSRIWAHFVFFITNVDRSINRSRSQPLDQGPETCILVGVELDVRPRNAGQAAPELSGYTPEESLEELAELAASAGAQVLGAVTQTREKYDPATLIGSGKVHEIRNWAAEAGAGVILFDQNLSPTQQRNLEKRCDCRVIDRTQLILDIFARHARTREGKLQVELAQLNYLLPRLAGRGVEMSRLGGGIGTRGPGETQLETDRRRIGRRIEKLKEEIEKVRVTRELQRKKRIGVPLATVALVGYTNAGKSTLFNALTAAGVLADARMFATLDPTIRVLDLPSRRRALVSDTVGFIRDLPPGLVKAFRATLEEVTQASLILHVADLSSPHCRDHMAEVGKVLTELDAAGKPQILVLNKSDLVEPADAAAILETERESRAAAAVLAISARRAEGLESLLETIDRLLPADRLSQQRFHFSFDEGDRLAFLYENARVIERTDTESGVDLIAEVTESVSKRLARNVQGA
jgi:GTP-binding protein HflX